MNFRLFSKYFLNDFCVLRIKLVFRKYGFCFLGIYSFSDEMGIKKVIYIFVCAYRRYSLLGWEDDKSYEIVVGSYKFRCRKGEGY